MTILIELPKPKEPKQTLSGVIRIEPDAEAILRRMGAETGLPISTIASEIIQQAAEYVQFV